MLSLARKAVQDGISSSTLDFLKLSNELSQDSVEHVCEVLASTALFRPCDSILPYMAAPKAFVEPKDHRFRAVFHRFSSFFSSVSR